MSYWKRYRLFVISKLFGNIARDETVYFLPATVYKHTFASQSYAWMGSLSLSYSMMTHTAG